MTELADYLQVTLFSLQREPSTLLDFGLLLTGSTQATQLSDDR